MSGKESEEGACSFFSSHAMTYPINYLHCFSSLKRKALQNKKGILCTLFLNVVTLRSMYFRIEDL